LNDRTGLMKEEDMIIAIDGPAGAGKSTIARQLAEALGYQLIDTGAIYRSVALFAGRAGVSVEDGPACARVARGLDFRFELSGGVNHIYCGEELLGDEIRTPEMSLGASRVSAHPEVRAALLELQRQLGRARDSVLEGRDIGTVVFPDADIKIFLTATGEERARRRVEQLAERGDVVDYAEILAQINERDERDASRDIAPLKPAEDSLLVDSTQLDIAQVIELISSRVREVEADAN